MKRGLSKNYFVFEGDPDIQDAVFDQRSIGEIFLQKQDDRHKKLAEAGLDINDIKTKILIYEERVKKWFLNIAEGLKKDNEAWFVILAIAVSYIEGNQQFREGKSSTRQSKKFFIKGMKRIFDKSDVPNQILEKYYDQIRCGLFHDCMTRKSVTLSSESKKPISYTTNQNNSDCLIKINPHKFFDKIREDFENYIFQLKEGYNDELIENFEKKWQLENE